MLTMIKAPEIKRSKDIQTSIRMWFRTSKIWSDFLEAKAVEEGCTKSDLIRDALQLAYCSQLEKFQGHQAVESSGSLVQGAAFIETSCGSPSKMVRPPDHVDADPWLESIGTFVVNKRSMQTRRVYRVALNEFFTFIGNHPSEVRQSDVLRYRYHLQDIARAPSTIRQHLAVISGYYSFCMSRNLTAHNPVRGVGGPSVDDYTRAGWLNRDQVRLLLSQPDRHALKGKRDYAILLSLVLTGLRRSELANIKRGDIQQRGDKLYLSYIGKGGTQTVRDIPWRCWEAIEEYLMASGRETTDESPVFAAVTGAGESLRCYYGKNGTDGYHPLTPEAIRQMIAHYAGCAFGSEVKVSPHTLRHTAGTLLRKSGRSIEELQRFLKHHRIDTTRRYLHVVEADDSEFGEEIAQALGL